MLSPAAHYLLFEFSEFWDSLKKGRAAGTIHEWVVHRVREEWVPWWLELSTERRTRIVNDLGSLSDEERAWFLRELRGMIESDCEQGDSLPNGPGSAEWVFMQFAHIESLEPSQVFAASRLDRVTGFKGLCLHPDKCLPIRTTLLRRAGEAPNYEYNIRLSDAVGVSSALAAVTHLLKGWNRAFFCRRPRGCSHHPRALRFPLIMSLVLGPLCIAIMYVAAAEGHLSEGLLTRLLYGTFLSALVFLVFWSIGIASDWRAERRLAAVLEESQVAWALEDVLPLPKSRNSLEIEGESYSAPLALSILRSLAAREHDTLSLISWHLRRAEKNAGKLGITGNLSPSGRVRRVDGLPGKKAIAIFEGLRMLSPEQDEATATDAEIQQGLKVSKCKTLQEMIWIASGKRSLNLWLGAAAAMLLLVFSFFARNLVLEPPAPDLQPDHPPIIEDRYHRAQHLILHFRTHCPECFVAYVHSKFWKPLGELHMAEPKDSDLAVLEVELVPEDNSAGNGMDSSIEIQRRRWLPFLPLPPVPVEETTFARINDMYERSKGVGKYAYTDH